MTDDLRGERAGVLTGPPARVTVGLPLFNGERYLAETLDSLLAQDFEHFEIVISDNGSTDGSPDICSAYAAREPRVHYLREPHNRGAAWNYNRLVDVAGTEYFKWTAHDDPCASSLLRRCVEALDSDGSAVSAHAKTILIDAVGAIIEMHEDRFDLRSGAPRRRLRGALRASAWCHPVFGVVRTDVLRRTGRIGPYASSDKVLLAELAVLGRCLEVPEHLSFRRLHDGCSTRANRTDEAMAAWFDPLAMSGVRAPRLHRWRELHRAIDRAGLDWVERLRCHVEVWRFYLRPRDVANRVRGLRRDAGRMARSRDLAPDSRRHGDPTG